MPNRVQGVTIELLIVFFYRSDIYDFFSQDRNKNQFDLVIAHAFMDLVDIEDILAHFCVFLKAGGLLYLTLNYDGETVFLPTIEKKFEDQIMVLYNQSMDKRRINGKKAGDSRTGRHLFGHLQRINAEVLAVGSSDWVVYPRSHTYLNDEAFFLHFIIETIDAELRGNPMLDSKKFEAWIQKRHVQIESGQVTYIAKQIDFLARVEGKGSKHSRYS